MPQFLTVGIGASAGGVQALRTFFQHTPADAGIAYVVILHLSPDHDSQLAQILQTVTAMPVIQLKDRVKVMADHVYVIPPNQHLTMEDGHIAATKNLTVEDRRAPVDIFFRSLAESHGANAICVVLSGTGANGSMGLKRVKERGGAVFAQRPSEAEFDEMPRNSIATELVDDVLSISEIPAHIVAYKERMGLVHIPEESTRRAEADQHALREIFKQLRIRTGNDFSNYKRPTLLRRIERRINVRALPDLPAYAVYLAEQPVETQALLKDLLISVTNFFRDDRAFMELERTVIPELFKAKRNEEQIRIWIAGCATGEEAYSFAMLCAEYMDNLINAPKLQIFATDIDEAALAIAREGLYTLNDAADVPPERLRRFFSYEGNAGYRARREIRESILFAQHNFLKDPPFSRLDLVSCRNVMIYLNNTAQERVMETFHFALNPGGFLFLGNAEGIEGSTDLYAIFNREQHIYQSRQVASRKFMVPESIPQFRTEHTVKEVQQDTIRNGERISYGELHQRLLEAYAPPSLVVNEEYDIVHISERAGRYLQVSGGELSRNLLKLIREELRLELRAALFQAVQGQTAVDVPSLKVRFDEREEIVNVSVRPVLGQNNNAKGFILVVFEPCTAGADDGERPVVFNGSEPIARQLEDENMRMKAQLRAANEQHEFGVEELKANNEELQAMNEELRSAAEELETSREELQSVNEELRTVNQELKVKVDESNTTNNNLRNLINSTAIGTVFLDRSFRVMLYTPAALEIFNLIPADQSRPISDITNRLQDDRLIEDAHSVLHRLAPIEREVTLRDGRGFLARLTPYRTDDDRIQGVVMTFLDISDRRRSELTAALLAEVSNELVGLDNVADTMASLGARIGRHFGVTHCVFVEAPDQESSVVVHGWNAPGTTSLLDTYAVSDFLSDEQLRASKAGDASVVSDTQADPRVNAQEYSALGVQSFVVVPLLRNGRWQFQIAIMDGKTRVWRGDEIALLREIAVRIWTRLERARAEQELSRRAAMDAFRVRLNDTLRPFSDRDEILRHVTQLVGETLQADSALYGAIASDGEHFNVNHDYGPGRAIRAAAAQFPAASFGDAVQSLRTGQTLVVPDLGAAGALPNADHGAFQATAVLYVPLLQAGRWVAFLAVHAATPRAWTKDEIMLLEEAAGRTWAALLRARAEEALRESEARARALIENMPDSAVFIVDHDLRYTLAEGEALRKAGSRPEDFVGKTVQEALGSPGTPQENSFREALSGQRFSVEHEQDGITFSTRGIPLRTASGEVYAALAISYDVTERRAAEEALRENEARLRTLSDTVPQLIWTNTAEGDANYFNRRWYEYSGRTREECYGLGWQVLVHPDDETASVARWRAALRAGEVFDTEFRLQDATGAYRWFIGRNVPLRDKRGEIIGWFGTATDIQELKKAQESVHESRESLRITMESATDYAIIAMDTAGIITGWSVGAELTFGYSQDDAIGQPTSLIFTPEDVAKGRPEQELAIAVADGKAPDERWHIRADGSRFYMSGVVRPIYDEVLMGFVKVARDMTATHEAQEALRISEERYRIALQSAGMGAWDWNLVTDHTVWNDQHFIMFGVEPTGKPVPASYFAQFVHPEDRERVQKSLSDAVERSGIYHTSFRIVRKDNGELRWMSGYGRVINRDGDRATRMVGVMYDITEQKQLEQQKDAFIGIASHELKTPVSSIKAYAEVLLEMFEEKGDVEQADLMRRMDEQVDRLAELIHALLDLTMLAEGKMQFRRERFDLTGLIRHTREEMQRTTRHEIVFSAQAGVYVTGDPERIRQVLFNLIFNAIKYSPGAECIVITMQQSGAEVITCVEDFGIGMSESVAANVFARFFRADDPVISTYPGLGLGLHISSEFIQRHGGRIWVARSEPGKGSMFCFSLPLDKTSDSRMFN